MIEALWSSAAYDRAFEYSERMRSRTFLDVLGTKVSLARIKRGSSDEERTLAALSD
jgi:hypothetical protein